MAIGIPYQEAGDYFPSIAENVGGNLEPAPPYRPGVRVVSRTLPAPPVEPTDYYPAIAENVGGFGNGYPAVPVGGAPMQGPPAPSPAQQDIGPGIPYQPGEAVTSTDIPGPPQAQTAPQGGPGFFQRLLAGGGGGIPRAGFPASGKYSSTRPEFIYTNPVAAQQAAANYGARLQFEAAQDQGYRDYLQRLQGQQAAQQTATANLAAQRQENELNRQSNERIANTSENARVQRQMEMDWRQNEAIALNGDQTAEMLNNPNANPLDLAKLDKRTVYMDPKTGKWKSRYAHMTYDEFNRKYSGRPPSLGAQAPEQPPAMAGGANPPAASGGPPAAGAAVGVPTAPQPGGGFWGLVGRAFPGAASIVP